MTVYNLKDIINIMYKGYEVKHMFKGSNLIWTASDLPLTETSRFELLKNLPVKNFVTDFGAIGDGVTDNSASVEAVMNSLNNESFKLYIPNGIYYYESETTPSTNTFGKALYMQGESAEGVVIKPKNMATNLNHQAEYKIMDLRTPAIEKNAIFFENIKFDGIENPQAEQYFTAYNSSERRQLRGISLYGFKNIGFKNVIFENMYGGFNIGALRYEYIEIDNVKFNNVGGKDLLEGYSSPWIFLSSHTGDAVVNIKNCKGWGMRSQSSHADRNPSAYQTYQEDMAWIAVVFESTDIQENGGWDENGHYIPQKEINQFLADKNTLINISNCDFKDVESFAHSETMAGNAYWNVFNTKWKGKNFFPVAGIDGEFKALIQDCEIDFYPWPRYGSMWGLSFWLNERDHNLGTKTNPDGQPILNEMVYNNCTINFDDVPIVDLNIHGHAISHGDAGMPTIRNSTLNNVPSQLTMNAGFTLLDSEINCAENNAYTTQQYITGFRNKPHEEKAEYIRTNINKFGEWKTAQRGANLSEVKPRGFKPPIFTGKRGASIQ